MVDLIISTPVRQQLENGVSVQIQKLPVMCIGEYGDITPYGRFKAKVVMTPFLYYPEVDCFYIDLPEEYDSWEEQKKKEHFIEQLNDNAEYLVYSEEKEHPTQLGTLIKKCHQGRLLRQLMTFFKVDFEDGHRLIREMMDKYLTPDWNEKSLVVPSKSIFIDRAVNGKLKFILFQITLTEYAQLRTIEDFLQHRVNILQNSLLTDEKEKMVAILLGKVWGLEDKARSWEKYDEIAYGMELIENELDSDLDIDEVMGGDEPEGDEPEGEEPESEELEGEEPGSSEEQENSQMESESSQESGGDEDEQVRPLCRACLARQAQN